MWWLALLGLFVFVILGIGAYLQHGWNNSEKIKKIIPELADDITFDNTIVCFHHGYISATHDFAFDEYCWTANVKYFYSSLTSKWYVLFSAVSCPIRTENNNVFSAYITGDVDNLRVSIEDIVHLCSPSEAEMYMQSSVELLQFIINYILDDSKSISRPVNEMQLVCDFLSLERKDTFSAMFNDDFGRN